MKKKNVLKVGVFALSGIVVFAIVFAVLMMTQDSGKSKNEITIEKAEKSLTKVLKNITVNNIPPIKAQIELETEDVASTLPDISKYPLQVDTNSELFIEIFSSPEKAGTGNDGWLVETAEEFNSNNYTVNGKKVSVKIRSMASGLGMDYISSGKYLPDAYSPSNEMWGEMLKVKGIKVELAEQRLIGNVAGILISKAKHEELIKKYGTINLKTIIEAVVNNEIAMGYTNPFSSSTGLNFLVSSLYTFDAKQPLGDAAVTEFEKFQTNIPFLAYTTLQMRESAKTGALDAFVLEYQLYANTPDLMSDYVFTPFGMRHDNPVFEIGTLSADKQKLLDMFIDFAKNTDNQKKASEYGFNNLDDYKFELGAFDSAIIPQAQKVWKEKKDVGQEIIAVFVADVSGSMEGEPLNRLKESLIKGSSYINKDYHIGLVTFSSDVNINLPIAKFDINQRSMFTGAIESLQASGSTAMFDSIAVATKMIVDYKVLYPNAKVMLFVLSDGETNIGHSLNDVTDFVTGYKIPIYTIGYNADISAMQQISNINEAASINADTDDVVYKIINLFNAQM